MRESNSPSPAVRPAGQKQSSGLFLGRGLPNPASPTKIAHKFNVKTLNL